MLLSFIINSLLLDNLVFQFSPQCWIPFHYLLTYIYIYIYIYIYHGQSKSSMAYQEKRAFVEIQISDLISV